MAMPTIKLLLVFPVYVLSSLVLISLFVFSTVFVINLSPFAHLIAGKSINTWQLLMFSLLPISFSYIVHRQVERLLNYRMGIIIKVLSAVVAIYLLVRLSINIGI